MAKRKWLLIDGYNLLHASGVFGSGGRTSLESSREALLDWLAEVLSANERKRTTIVFDAQYAPPGLPRHGEKHGVRIRFAPRGCEADDVVEELIRSHTVPRELTVVSSDHRLQRAAKRRRARGVDSERWVAQLKKKSHRNAGRSLPPNKEAPELSEAEIQAWLDEFKQQ